MIFIGSGKNKAAKRKKSHNKKPLKAICSLVGLSVCVLLFFVIKIGCNWFLHTDLLKINNIDITGCNIINKNKLIQRAGIEKGDNILAINLKEKSRILEKDPWVYKAVVKRRLPDRIEIQIKEREPLAVIQLDNFYLVDRHGDIFEKIERSETDLPLLTGLKKDDFINKPQESSRVLNAALSLIENLQKNNLLNGCNTEIEMDGFFGLKVFNAADQTNIFLGFDGYKEKLDLLHKIVEDLSRKGLSAEAVNLTSDKKVYIKLKSSSI